MSRVRNGVDKIVSPTTRREEEPMRIVRRAIMQEWHEVGRDFDPNLPVHICGHVGKQHPCSEDGIADLLIDAFD